MPEFQCNTPISIQVSIASGSVSITAEERDTASVVVMPLGDNEQSRAAAEDTEVIIDSDKLVIEAPPKSGRWFQGEASIVVDVRAPIDSSARVGIASASVKCHGRYSQVDVNSASGDVEIDEVTGDAKIQTASGDVRIVGVGGQLAADTASGDVAVAQVDGPARLNTASGDMAIARAGSDVHSRSASGDLRIGAAHKGTISANSASGDVSVGVVSDTGVWLDLDSVSGSISNGLDTAGTPPDTHDLSIQIRTVSGDIDILRARSKAAV